jgi:hypothetical protein
MRCPSAPASWACGGTTPGDAVSHASRTTLELRLERRGAIKSGCRIRGLTEKAMSDLLDLVLHAHGGLDNWKSVTSVDVRMTLGGYLFEIKQHPDGLRSALVKVSTQRPRTLIVPFPEKGKRGIYQDGRAWIQTDPGEIVEELLEPRKAYVGHERRTPWNDLQYLYFIGYAFWNYFTTPFLLASDAVTCEEVDPWEENNQRWRVLKATFAESIDTHCAVQKFYFDDKGMLQRHDYFTDVAKGNVAHYCMDHKNFDGFIFPTRRRVVARDERDLAATAGPSSILIDVESLVISTNN